MTNPDASSHQQQQQQQQQQLSSSSLDPPAAVNDEPVNTILPAANNSNVHANGNAVVDRDRIATAIPEDPSPRTLKLWHEVALGIDKNSTGKSEYILSSY